MQKLLNAAEKPGDFGSIYQVTLGKSIDLSNPLFPHLSENVYSQLSKLF